MSRKRSRSSSSSAPSASASAASPAILLSGGSQALHRDAVDKFRAGELCDVELKPADGETVGAHRIVLVGASKYFKTLWSGKWPGDCRGPLDLTALSPACLKACLEFAYTGEAEVADEDALAELLAGAAFLQMDELLEAAAEAYESRLAASNALAVWELADRIGRLPRLAEAAAKAARANFGEVVAGGEAWTAAPASIVRSLLEDDRLRASEEEVYRAGVTWLQAHDPPPGEEEVAALLSRVRFALLPREFLNGVVMEEPLLDTRVGKQMLLEAPGLAIMSTARPRPRTGGFFLYAVGGMSSPSTSAVLSSVERCDPATSAWEAVTSITTARHDLGAAVLEGKLYAVGGYGGGHLSSVERYDPATNAWETVAPLLTARANCGVSVLDGKLYAVGGFNNDNSWLSSVERYDPVANVWEAVTPLSTARSRVGVAVLDGKLYAAGGWDGEESHTEVERYDPATNAWEVMVAPLLTARDTFGLVGVDGKLYAVGGGRANGQTPTSVERYDPTANAWEVVAPMAKRRQGQGVAVLDGNLYAVGGCMCDNDESDGFLYLNSVERYDLATNAWEAMAPPMATERAFFGLVSM